MMNQAEASVSKSVSSVGSTTQDATNLNQGKTVFVDTIFPLYDQMMQKTRFPAWFLSIVAVYMLMQVLSIGFWIYAPPFERATGKWRNLYNTLVEIFVFQDPLDFYGFHPKNIYLCGGVALFSLIWIIAMIYYNEKKYMIPTILLYISSIIIDIIDPCLITPAVFTMCHGITGLYRHFDAELIAEVTIGCITYIVFVTIFYTSMVLKSRSVVLTNLTFPLFDASSITTWVLITSFGCILSAIFEIFDDWIYTVLGVIHLLVTLYVCYRLSFIPFYEVWRNSICLAIGITTCALDLNFFILYAFSKLSFNYTVFVLVGTLLVSYILMTVYFTKKVARIQKNLMRQPDVTNASEYLHSLKIDKNQQTAMMYIVVGLARLGEYFVDGSLTDFIINSGTMESSISILLQVVTFFPSESRKMDILYKKLLTKRKLSFSDRFLVYQVYRIKTRRLISDTKDTLEMFNKLRAKNDECKSIIRGFWDMQQADVSFLSSLSIKLSDLNSFFKYAISNIPNNLRITTEYADFLAECMTDFDKAIVQSVRAELIGNGRNFNVDISFRSVVNKFPHYLKDKILDTKGRRIGQHYKDSEKSKSLSSSTSNSNSNENMNDGSQFSLDFELQESVSNKLIRDSKVRLAFHHGIMGMKPIQSYLILGSATLLLVSCLVVIIGFYVYFRDSIYYRETAYYDIRSTGYSLFYTYLGNYYALSQWSKMTGRKLENNDILGNISIDKTTTKPVLPENMSNPQKIQVTVQSAKNSMVTLFDSLAELANEFNAYDIGTNLLRQESKLMVCKDGAPYKSIPATVKDQIIMMNFFQSQFSGDFAMGNKINNIYASNDWCQVLINSFILSENSAMSLESILEFSLRQARGNTKNFKLWCIIGAINIFFWSAVPAVIIIQSYNFMTNKTIKMLLALPQSIKEDAKKPLLLTANHDETIHIGKKNENSQVMDTIGKVFFFFLFTEIALYCVMCWQSWKFNDELSMMYDWYYYSCVRVIAATEIGNNVMNLIFINESMPQKIVSIKDLRDQVIEDLNDFIEADRILLDGDHDTKKITGWDEAYDKMQLQEVCSLGRDPKTIHDMYACAGIEHQIIIFKNMVTDILNNPGKYHGAIDDEVSMNIAHLLQFHFYPRVIAATVRMRDMINERFAAGVKTTLIYLVACLIVSMILFVLPWLFRYFVNENFNVLLMSFKHISPQAIIDTSEIMNFFMHGQKTSSKEEMTLSKSIVMDASECIIITNQNAIIDIINNAVTANLSLTPDQMLGQHIANFVSDKEQQKLNQQIDLMVSGQGSTVWQDHLLLINDTAQPIPFAVTMIGVKDEMNQVTSIVFILTNETEEIKKHAEAEAAKAKSEKLLYQILPKDIVVRLNRGETDISFTIPSASIFFIDIVKFSLYASTLTPSEIMTNLSTVFATFDSIVAHYPSITKIKLIGDVYMAASGLFETEPTTKHAEDAVRCCIQCQKSMEEINMRLNASLEIRIGVNSGGPLIGGVLGSDKPTFDIIGDPINVAARLQSTDVPGNVQISETTKEMIENLDFEIEQRGEIYLKGKGKQVTYFVSKRDKVDSEGSFALSFQ